MYSCSNNQCSKYKDKSECELYSAWASRNEAKKNIMQPNHIEHELHGSKLQSKDFTGFIQNKEIISFLDEQIQTEYRESYLKLKHGSNIPKQQLLKLQKHITELMENFTWSKSPEKEDN
jgi:hypothetical protein